MDGACRSIEIAHHDAPLQHEVPPVKMRLIGSAGSWIGRTNEGLSAIRAVGRWLDQFAWGNEANAGGVECGLCTAGQPELAEQVAHMDAYGLFTDRQGI